MSELPVSEMVLYKHGVGYFVRSGAADATEVSLTFRQDEINDVLKSLAVFDRAGGQVLGIHYQTPMDKEARLASSSIRLSNQASLHDLLRDLRGRRATLTFEIAPGSTETVTGRMIGVDQSDEQTRPLFGKNSQTARVTSSSVSLLADDGQVRIFDFNALRGVSIQNAQAEHDLTYFLDTSMSEDVRRTVAVRLSEGSHQLIVSYVAPTPTWRVSYRVVAEADKNGETGKALLQGWGLFDNCLEEDLENVQVTLVAGQPISFIYDLCTSRIPERPSVQDETRIAPGPVEFDASLPIFDEIRSTATEGVPAVLDLPDFIGNPFATADQPARTPKRRAGYEEMAKVMPPTAQTKDSGEFFQYVVTTPVTVKRGESALVPIIGAEVNYQRELLYNGDKLPKHPVVALRFVNTIGLTLERGPVTVVENSDYKGEAIVPFTKDGNEVYLPYAVELGVQVTERAESRTETAGLSIDQAYLVYEEYQVQATTYVIENTTAKPATILIEAPIQTGYEPFDMPPAAAETATDRRWRVVVQTRQQLEFTRKERHHTQRREQLRDLSYQRLQQFLKNQWLDQATMQQLSEMLDELTFIQRSRNEIRKMEGSRDGLYKQQEQLRANLSTLNPSGQEAGLRNRVLKQLESTQDRLEEIERRVTEINGQVGDAEAQVQQIIDRLG